MGKPIARADDQVLATDIHIVLVPAVAPVPTPLPHVFSGKLDGSLSTSVKANGRPVATIGSTATNQPAHIPPPPGVSFQKPPSNRATVMLGSANVLVQGKPAARAGDTALTCNDPADLPIGSIVAAGTVMVGG